jgi:predicted permease
MFWKRRRSDEDFDEEIRAHIQIEADRLVEDGMDPSEALAAARRAFGNVTGARERFYESTRWMWLDRLVRDVRFAARRMRRTPVATATIVLSLAIGIGATTALFSLADQALVRVLPVREPERLVQLHWEGPFMGSGMGSVGYGSLIPYLLYRDLNGENDLFDTMFARSPADVHLSVGGESEPVTVELITGSYFPALGVRPAAGRLLDDADDVHLDAHPVVVLSYDYWRSRLGADPAIVGREVRINDSPMTVVGVAEQGFHGMDWGAAPALWVPAMMKGRVTPGWNGLFERRTRFLHVFGRLKPGVSREQAEAQLQPWFKAYLRADTGREGWPGATEEQMRQYLASSLDLLPAATGVSHARDQVRQPMLILLAASGLILLLACLNVANLSLARALARRRATALRAALGASRGRIVAEQLVESALLAAVGCCAGALLAPLVSRSLLSFLPQQGAGGVALSTGLDLRALAFALAITTLTTLLCGAAPALYAASVGPMEALKQQSSAVASGLGLRKALVAGQFALALVLLVGAGLFARTLGTLRAQGPGYPTTNLLTFRVDPPSDGIGVAESKPLIRRLLAEVQGLPEVERAGAGRWEMLSGSGWNGPVTVVQSGRRIVAEYAALNAVSPDFFEVLSVPVTRGRAFDARDARDDSEWALRSAIVNEEFVRRYLGGGDPLGARLGFGDAPDTVAGVEVVGVVKTFSDRSLREPEPQAFFPLWERSVEAGTFYVRTRSSSQAAAGSIRAAVGRADPRLTVLSLHAVDDQLDRLLATERMLAVLAGSFAAVATLLAMVGLYGVLSFSAASRTKEIGVRLALGASRWEAGGLILRETAVLAGAGLAAGFPVAWALGRLVESQLFGVRPLDASTLAGAGAILALVCLVASAVPARRAGSVNPLEALRSE